MYCDDENGCSECDSVRAELKTVTDFLREIITNNPTAKVSDDLQDWWQDTLAEDLRRKMDEEKKRKAAQERKAKEIAKLKARLKELQQDGDA